MSTNVVSLVIVLGVLVFVHEFGHFIVAKILGVGVEKFSLGFGPRVLGKKIGMTRVFVEGGGSVPVTVIQAGPCPILQTKSKARDGYEAVQIGLVEHLAAGRISKPRRGQFEKHKLPPMRHVQEFPVAGDGPVVVQNEMLEP